MKSLRLMLAGGLLAGWLPSAAAFNLDLNRLVDTVKDISTATKEFSPEEEKALGRQTAALLLGASPPVKDKAMQLYVNRVGRWLALHSGVDHVDWQFGVLDTASVNAFATPGGYVFVTSGLLARMQNEAELAGVLAHEIAHVVQQHHLKAIRKGAGISAGANILAELGSRNTRNDAAVQHLTGGIKEVLLRGLDKDDEYEADRLGIVIATRAGYDPLGLVSVLQMLSSVRADDDALALMFSTHPSAGARLDALDEVVGVRLDDYMTQPQQRARFVKKTASLRAKRE